MSQYRHMWYLTEELVIFSLADSGTSDDTKARIVASMLAAGCPHNFSAGKPVMKPELLVFGKTVLADIPFLQPDCGLDRASPCTMGYAC